MSGIVVLQPTARFVVEWEELEELTVDPDVVEVDAVALVKAIRDRLAVADPNDFPPEPDDDRDAMIGEPLF